MFGILPSLYIPVSGFVVTPVLGWWHRRTPVAPVDPAETARVFTVPVSDLTDPGNRVMAVHPAGHVGPAFLVGSALVWGFTAGLIDRILHYAGWERPWGPRPPGPARLEGVTPAIDDPRAPRSRARMRRCLFRSPGAAAARRPPGPGPGAGAALGPVRPACRVLPERGEWTAGMDPRRG